MVAAFFVTFMNLEQTWADLQSLPALILKINKREKESIALLNKLSKLLYGESVTAGCTNCHIKAYHKLTSITYLDLKEMSEKKFVLKKGITVEYPVRGGRHFNHLTITDDIAREFLINVPSAIQHFDSYPVDNNGKLDLSGSLPIAGGSETVEVAKGSDENEAKPLEKMNKKELQAKYLEVLGVVAPEDTNKKELISAINAK